MAKSLLSGMSVGALVGCAMFALELQPVSAFTLPGPSMQPVTSGQFDQVYYRAVRGGVYRGGYHGGVYRGGVYRGGYAHRGYRYGGYGYHGGYYGGYGYHPYGYGAAAAVGAAAVGAAAVGAAVAHQCWINNYGVQVCN